MITCQKCLYILLLQMDESRHISPFRCESIEKNKLSREWETWKWSLECYFAAYDISDQKIMRAKLLHLGGVELQRIFRSLPEHDKSPLVALEPKVYDLAIELLDTYFQTGRQDVIERRKLRKIKQEANEKFSHYVIRLRQQSLNCGFEKHPAKVAEILKEIYLIDVIVENCRSDELRKAILKRDRSIREIEEIASTIEDTDQQMKELKENNTSREVAVYEVNRSGQARATWRRRTTVERKPLQGYPSGRFKRQLDTKPIPFKTSKYSCFACGQQGHLANSRDCPARGRMCRRCRELGHFETVCKKQKQGSSAVKTQRNIHNIEESQEAQKDILGDATAKKLGVLKVGIDVNQINAETKPFSKINGVKAHIRMMEDARPVFQPLRRIPIPMEDAVNRKLENLLIRDIIEVKQGPSTWVSPLVIVGKASGEPRICLDLRRVNEAVVREHFPMPVVDEYLARLGGGKMWSKLDIREAFHQVELAEDSRDVTTFITNKGLFRFKRLPFGLVTAPEVFQRIMEEILAGCEGTYWYLDDVMVEGETKEIHDKNLKKVL